MPGSIRSPTWVIVSATIAPGRGDGRSISAGLLADDHAAAPSPSSSSAAAISTATSPIERGGVQRHELPGRPVVLDDRLGVVVVDRRGAARWRPAVVRAAFAPRSRRGAARARGWSGRSKKQHGVEATGRSRASIAPSWSRPAQGCAGSRRGRSRRAAVGSGQALADQRNGEVVGDRVTAREDRLDLTAELGPLCDRRPEHLAGRDVRDPADRPRSASPASPSRSPAARERGDSPGGRNPS